MSNSSATTRPRALDNVANALVCFYFFLAPWGMYALLPVDNAHLIDSPLFLTQFLFSLTGICTILLPILAITRLIVKREWPIPLELTWPLAAICIIGISSAFIGIPVSEVDAGSLTTSFLTAGGWQTLVIILCVPHWTTIRDALVLYVLSGTCVALLCVLAYFKLVIPTMWPIDDNALVLAGTHTFTLFLKCALVGLLLASTRVLPLWLRIAMGLLALSTGALYCYYRSMYAFQFAPASFFTLREILALGLMYWFVARLIAKAWLRRKELRQESQENAAHASMLLGTCILIVTFLFLQQMISPSFSITMILSLLVAYVIRVDQSGYGTLPSHGKGLAIVAVLASIPLLLYNVLNVSPNFMDTRNYEALARWAGGSKFLEDTFHSINQLYPGERNSYYWLARGRLESGDAIGSVDYYLKSLEPGDPVIIKEYPEDLKESYLAELRGASSTLEQDAPGLPYERVLLATGRADAAMSLLKLKAEKFAGAESPISRTVMLYVLAKILRRDDIDRVFENWSDELIFGLLRQQAVTFNATDGDAISILCITISEDSIEFELWRDGNTNGGVFAMPEPEKTRLDKFESIQTEHVRLTDTAIEMPLFTITLDTEPKLQIADDAYRKRPLVYADNMFTRQLIIVFH